MRFTYFILLLGLNYSLRGQFAEIFTPAFDCSFNNGNKLLIGVETGFGVDFDSIPDTVIVNINGLSIYGKGYYDYKFIPDKLGEFKIHAQLIYDKDTIFLDKQFVVCNPRAIMFMPVIGETSSGEVISIKVIDSISGVDITELFHFCITEFTVYCPNKKEIGKGFGGGVLNCDFIENILNYTLKPNSIISITGIHLVENGFIHSRYFEIDLDCIISRSG